MSSRPSAGWFEYLPVQLLVLAAVCVVSLWSAWIGFVASDDEYYVMSALGWREHFPRTAPDDHFRADERGGVAGACLRST